MIKNKFYILIFLFVLFNSSLYAQSTVGTDFWVTFLPNEDDLETLTLIATGNNSCTGVVTNPLTGWNSSFSISPGSITNINIPITQAYDRNASDAIINKALHITSTDSISLYANNYGPFTFDVTNVLPTAFLSSDYIVQTYKSQSEFSIIATEDSTTITINLAENSLNNTANNPFSITLNAGQCYQVQSETGIDLSGSTITANDSKKIAIFAGNLCNRVPYEEEGRDHLFEQMIPTAYWGNEFIVTNSMLRANDRIRVTALNDGCQIKKDGILLTTINATEIYEFEITNNPPVAYIETSEPANIFLYCTGAWYGGIDGDPSMVVINPIDQRINNVRLTTFNTNTSQHHFINIITKTSNVTNMRLDNNNISSNFNIVPSKPDFSYARMEINHGIHTLNNVFHGSENGFVAHVYGMRPWEAYSYSVCSLVIDTSTKSHLIVNDLSSLDYPDGFEICHNMDSSFTFSLSLDFIPSNVLWDFGDGTTGEGYPITHHYDNLGTYNVLCNIYTMENGMEHLKTTISTIISIKQAYDTTITATICANDVYTDNGFNENETGVYINTLQTIEGCDSIIRLNLTANPTHNDTIIGKICEGEVYDLYGFYGTHDTIITKLLQTQFGCDSIITLDLKVGIPYNDTIHATIREGQYYDEYGFYEHREGFYSIHSISSYGCDSSTYLVLNVDPKLDLYVENCITPLSPNNNTFDIIHDEALIIDDVYIYNRAGGLIFHSPNNAQPWNGKYKGEYCPQAAYAYLIYYRQVGVMGQKVKTGTLLLIY